MVAEDDEMSKEEEIDKLMALISLSFKKIYKPTNNNLRTSSNTNRANQDNYPRINRGTGYDNQRAVNVAGARENVGTQVVQQSRIQCYNYKEYGHVARECQKPKRAKDVAYHKEKIGDDPEMRPTINEFEALYKYYCIDIKKLLPMLARYLENILDNCNLVNDITNMETTGDTNITIDSLDMSYDREQDDQDDIDDLAKERDLLAFLIAKLKCEIDDNKNRNKFLETLNKALVDILKGEIEAFKTKNKSTEHESIVCNYASKVATDCAKAKGDLIMIIPRPDGIKLDVWNDRIFMVDPLRYDRGVLLNMFVARLNFKEFERMIIKETNCANLFAMYYRIPDRDLEKGLVKVVNDYDLIHMYDMSKMYSGIELYLDHCNINLSQYLADPDPTTVSDGTSKKRATPHKRYYNVFTKEEMVSWAEKEAEEEAMLRKGKEKTNVGDKEKKCASEEELIQLRTRKANKSKIRPPLILDMAAFASTSRATASNKNDVLVEHDDFIADLLRKLKGDGEDSNLQDPFVGVKETKDKYPTHDQSTHWRMKTPKLEEKFVDAAELKDCLTYYALSNGYLIWKNPEIKLCDIADLVMKKYKCTITPNQCRSAKIWALSEYEKTREEHYRLLRSYGKELLDTNPGSTIKLGVTNTDDKTYFERFYVCFGRLKEGFKNGCRRVVALDGCFLKSPNQGADLDMPTSQGLTLMSDQHKGLIEAVKQVMPDDDHRKIMEQIKAANPDAYQYLIDKDLKTWSKAFLKVIVIERMNTMRKISTTWTDDICPSILKRIDLMKNHTRFWHVIHTSGESFEVRSGSDALKVDLSTRTCSCRMWQLSGLPCVNAIFKINKMPEEYVPNWFRKHLYYATYHNYLSLVSGIDFWSDQSQFSKVLPPKLRVMLGRPRKKRIKASHEDGSGTRVSKVGGQVTCQNYFQVGHNKKGCKAPHVQKPVMEKKKARRTRKADATNVGGFANPLGGYANPMGGSKNPLGKSAIGVGATGMGRSGVGRSATSLGRSGVGRSGVGRSATGVGRNATSLGRSGSGVGRSRTGVGVNATGLGRSATLTNEEGMNESANQHDDEIDVGGSANVFVRSVSGVGGSVQGTGGSGIGRGVVRGCDIPGLKWSPP
ncbi:multidrug resistance-associated protein 5 [Tanacetum coccineum]